MIISAETRGPAVTMTRFERLGVWQEEHLEWAKRTRKLSAVLPEDRQIARTWVLDHVGDASGGRMVRPLMAAWAEAGDRRYAAFVEVGHAALGASAGASISDIAHGLSLHEGDIRRAVSAARATPDSPFRQEIARIVERQAPPNPWSWVWEVVALMEIWERAADHVALLAQRKITELAWRAGVPVEWIAAEADRDVEWVLELVGGRPTPVVSLRTPDYPPPADPALSPDDPWVTTWRADRSVSL